MSTRTSREIRAFLVDAMVDRLRCQPAEIDVEAPFVGIGLSSADAVVIAGKLGEWLDTSLSPTLLWKYPSIATLADALSGASDYTGEAETRTVDEPIAIVGIGCRYAGVRGPDEFWRMLMEGRDTVTVASAERENWPYSGKPAPRAGRAPWYGSFLDDPYLFDAGFFRISEDEAARMDPQQRHLLETVVDALDDAGVPLDRIAGTETGVFVGVPPSDYGRPRMNYPTPNVLLGTGNATSMVANRVSYVFDLHGPSVNVDTACSSSLVALHNAVRAIGAGDCTQAIVAGVNITLDPFATDCLADAGLMASDGRCKTFDDRADGYVRGEAAVAVLVKPLSVARADGDRVYGVILGSAVNSDGRTNGLTAPNQQAQQVVVRRAYQAANVSPADVRYVELHGTGTSVGDPIEARSLSAVVAPDRADGDVVLVGSAKTNVGHTETASGLTGVIKTALAIHHGAIPPSLHFRNANPMIPLDELKLSVVTEPTSWPAGRRLAGVSSFGWGGTNAHVVLSDVEDVEAKPRRRSVAGRPHVVALSGRSERSVAAAVRDLLTVDSVDLGSLAHTSTVRRTAHPLRVAAVVRDQAELTASLRSLADGVVPDDVVVGRLPNGGVGRLAFAFTGQGNQWLAMGRALIRREPVFRDALLECDRPLRRALGWSPFAVLDRGKDADQLRDTKYAQPTIFALQVALARLWASWGVVPDMVVGHSMGEIAAAHVAGVLDLPTAATLIAARADAMAGTRGLGRMAVVQLSATELAPWLVDHTDVVLAGTNSPTWSLLSGLAQPLTDLCDKLAADGVLVRKLDGEYAFHGPWMADSVGTFRHTMPELAPVDTPIAFYSTVTGGRVDGSTLDNSYWCAEALSPVAFAEAVDAMIGDGCLTFVEVGPHPALSPMLTEAFRHRDSVGVVVGTLRRDADDDLRMRTALATVWANGYEVDWATAAGAGDLIDLPPYPFDRRAYRTEPPMPDAVSIQEPVVVPVTEPTPSLFAVGAGYVAPSTDAERFVAALWGDLLGLEQVGASDSFQQLGGSSLVALQFISRVLADTGVELPITQLLDRPTVAGVAAVLDTEIAKAGRSLPVA